MTSYIFMLLSTDASYSGLRGAMAFALALQSVHDLPDGHGETIFTATTSIVVLTVSRWVEFVPHYIEMNFIFKVNKNEHRISVWK